MDLRQKYGGYAVVTGASAGIGAEFARIMAEKGMNLVLVARREDKLKELSSSIEADHGVKAEVLPLDLAREDSHLALFEAVKGLDVGILVNNAGFGYYGRFVDQDPGRFPEMIKLNILTFTMLTHTFANHFIKRGGGGIVLVSSLAAFQPTAGMALYGATKGFELLLGEAFSEEIRGKNVDVTVLCPGATLTEFQTVAGGVPHDGMSARDVAMCAVNCLGKKRIAIPGAANKITGKLHRFLPRSWVRRITAIALSHYLPGEGGEAR